MKDLTNKLLLFAVCSYFLPFTGRDFFSTVALTLALTVTSLCSWLGRGCSSTILIVLFCAFSIWQPEGGVYLPLLLYDILPVRRQVKQDYLRLLIVGTTALPVLFHLPPLLAVPWFLTITGSIALSVYSAKIDSLISELHQTRDKGAESTILLQERNHALTQQQNYEIHLATLSERNRIAREIHDNVGHMLTRSILQTGALKVINQDPSLDKPLSTLHDTLNTAMTSIRSSVHDLHDESIDLQAALQDIVSGIETPSITLDYDAGNSQPKEIKYAFISIIKEALNNIQKHSDASKAVIILREHPGFYRLQIQDNGTKKPVFNKGNGIGLSNMKERVHDLGGSIHFSTENGFCINISILKKEG